MKLIKWIGLYDLYLIFNPDPKLLEKRNKELEGTIWDENRTKK